ncbi:MAG: flagellar biosynthesis protein FliQ [Pseudomonadota bacterium]
MTGAEVLDLGRGAIYTLLIMSGPPMAIGLGVGLIIALFQALTQIQEMTLTFVPKIIAIFLSLLVLLPFMGTALASMTEQLMARIVTG